MPSPRLVVAAAVLLGLAACDGPGDAGDPPPSAEVVAALCRAVDAADEGDARRARIEFEDVHVALHSLADRVAETDRQRAGELLRAKQVVEADLSRTPAPRLATRLRDLAVATAHAGGTDPPNCV